MLAAGFLFVSRPTPGVGRDTKSPAYRRSAPPTCRACVSSNVSGFHFHAPKQHGIAGNKTSSSPLRTYEQVDDHSFNALLLEKERRHPFQVLPRFSSFRKQLIQTHIYFDKVSIQIQFFQCLDFHHSFFIHLPALIASIFPPPRNAHDNPCPSQGNPLPFVRLFP